MLRSHRVIGAIGVLLVLSIGPSAWATIENLKSYKAAYPGKDPKAYSCKTCHQGAIGKSSDLNAYGVALKMFKGEQGAKTLSPDDFTAFDAADLDADGATNAQELGAGTDVLDPASSPAGAAPAAGQPAAAAPGEPATPEPQEVAPSDKGKPEDPHEHHSAEPGSRGTVSAYLDRLLTPEAWADAPKPKTAAEEPAVAEYVGTDTCAGCHVKEFKEFQHSTHARIAVPGENMKAQGCESCHGPGSLHVAAGGGKGVGGIINPRKDPSTCFACHLDKKAEFRLPYHHPLLEGKMSCADCHNAHGEDVRPWSATGLKDINEACFKCHKDQRGPFVWEHEALREGCTTCHKVHGSIHEKMLIARDANLCLRCHTQTNFPTIGKSSHSSRLPQGTCFSGGCHTAVHGSNFDAHLRY